MFRHKLKYIDNDFIYWDVRIPLKHNSTVRDYLDEIKMIAEKNGERRNAWIYSNGLNVGYVNFDKNDATYYCNGNLNVWDRTVARCECIANSASYLYLIWTKDDEEYSYEPVRPVMPSLLSYIKL